MRFLTAGVGIPLFLLLLYAGGAWWAGLILSLTLLASREMGELLRRVSPNKNTPSLLLLMIGGVLFVLLAYTSATPAGLPPALSMLLLVSLLFAAFVRELFIAQRAPVHGVGGTLLGTVYPGALFAHLVLLRSLSHGFEWTLLVTLATWASDSAAYFVGSALGRRPLLPSVSPKKTWEGAVAGCGGGVLAGLVFALFTPLSLPAGIAGGLAVSLAGQIGDLAASSLKRQAQVKDAGTLLPGHGGILDRFDSMLFAGTVIYYSLLLLGGWPTG